MVFVAYIPQRTKRTQNCRVGFIILQRCAVGQRNSKIILAEVDRCAVTGAVTKHYIPRVWLSLYLGWAIAHFLHLILALHQLSIQLLNLLVHRFSTTVNLCTRHKETKGEKFQVNIPSKLRQAAQKHRPSRDRTPATASVNDGGGALGLEDPKSLFILRRSSFQMISDLSTSQFQNDKTVFKKKQSMLPSADSWDKIGRLAPSLFSPCIKRTVDLSLVPTTNTWREIRKLTSLRWLSLSLSFFFHEHSLSTPKLALSPSDNVT